MFWNLPGVSIQLVCSCWQRAWALGNARCFCSNVSIFPLFQVLRANIGEWSPMVRTWTWMWYKWPEHQFGQVARTSVWTVMVLKTLANISPSQLPCFVNFVILKSLHTQRFPKDVCHHFKVLRSLANTEWPADCPLIHSWVVKSPPYIDRCSWRTNDTVWPCSISLYT